jgi:hypothetical protein
MTVNSATPALIQQHNAYRHSVVENDQVVTLSQKESLVAGWSDSLASFPIAVHVRLADFKCSIQ